MMWMEGLQRRPAPEDPYREGVRWPQAVAGGDDTLARVDALVRTLYNQMNQSLLDGSGSVWGGAAAWGVHLWELWWEPTRARGPYFVVTLLRDSHGTPYLKVQGRRLPLADTRLERRLQRALRAAFLSPRIYTPRADSTVGAYELPRPVSMSSGRAEDRRSDSVPDLPSEAGDAEPGHPVDANRGQGRHNGRDTT